MSSHDELLQQGIAAARAGQQDLARQLLAQAIKANPNSEAAWIWMSSVVATNEQRIHCLRQVLVINPANELAQRGLKALGGAAQPPAARPYEPAPAPVAPAPDAAPQPPVQAPPRPVPPAPDGVPLIDPQVVSAAQQDAEVSLHQFHDQANAPLAMVHWASAEALHQRPGLSLRAVAPFILIGVAGIIIVVMVTAFTNSLLGLVGSIGRAQPAQPTVVAAVRPTALPSPTKRPPRTATPQGTPYISGPTLAPGAAPHANLSFGKLTATPPYVNTPHPSSPPMNAALKAFNAGYYPDALDSVATARANGDDSLDGYYIEGMSLAHTFEYAQAISAFNDGLAKNDQFAPLHAGLAYAYLQTSSLEQARAEAQKAITLDNQLVMGYVVLSQAQTADGDFAGALSTVADGRSKTSGYDVNLIVAEGDIYLAQSDFTRATADGNLAYYIDPTAEGAVLLLARGQIGLKLTNSATVILENYIDNVNPGSGEAWGLLARLYNQQGRLADALEADNRAIQLSANQSDALASRGLLYLAQGKLDLACADLNNALQSDSQNYDARLGRAQCAYALGQYDEAAGDVTFLLAVTPNNPGVQTLHVQVLVRQQKYNDAITAASAALKSGLLSQDQLGDVYEAWGYALYQLGNYSEAASDIEAALKIAETGTRHYDKGLILEALHDYPRASREYEWVLFWNQVYDYPFAADAAKHLSAVSGQATPTPTASPSPSPTPTRTPSPTLSPTPSRTPSPTPSPTSTRTPRPTPSASPTPKATTTPGG